MQKRIREMEGPTQTVLVAALTYRRPEMLSQLLASLLAIERPEGWDVRFLIVDNDPQGSAKPVVERFFVRFEGRLTYLVEPEPGIPYARNRALDEAASVGARFLCFLDDDEYPDRSWLTALIAHQRGTGVVLIGGPVRLLPPDFPTTAWQSFLARSLIARSRFMERHSAKRARQGTIMVVATNNWMGDICWIRARKLRFDTRMQFSGGTDTAFFIGTRSCGGVASWCETAIVYEHLAKERLSVRYQFRRSKDQGTVLARLQPDSPVRMCVRQSLRMIAGAGLLLIPAFGTASFTLGIHMIAAAVGRFSSLFGAQSRLYARPVDNSH